MVVQNASSTTPNSRSGVHIDLRLIFEMGSTFSELAQVLASRVTHFTCQLLNLL